MAGLTERRWTDVLQTFVLDGGTDGSVTVSDTAGFHTKQQVQLISATVPRATYEVKRVVSSTVLWVGPVSSNIDAKSNVSAYLVGDGAQINAVEQQRPGIDYPFIFRHVYQEEPAVALRVMAVDQYGRPIASGGTISDVNVRDGSGNPITSTVVGAQRGLDVNLTNVSLDVNISALAPDSDSIRVYGIDFLGTQRQALVDTAGRLIIAPSSTAAAEADFASNPTGDGTVALTVGGPDEIAATPHLTDTYNIMAWRWSTDEPCQLWLEIRDSGVLVEVLDTVCTDGGPGSREFPTHLEIAGAAGRAIRVVAKRLQNNTVTGHASAGVNGYIS